MEWELPLRRGRWVLGSFCRIFSTVTGILTGLSLSGSQRIEKDIPYGTMGAVLVGLVIYMIIPLALAHIESCAEDNN